METKEKVFQLNDLLEFSGRLAALAAALVLVFYAVGFLIVSFYYSALGVFAHGVLKTRYLTAAGSYLFFLFVIYLPYMFFFMLKVVGRMIPNLLTKLILLVYIVWTFIRVFLPQMRENPISSQSGILGLIIVFLPLLFSVYVLIPGFLRDFLEGMPKLRPIRLIGFTSMLFFFVPGMYGYTLYPGTSRHMGGGKPSIVRFILTHEPDLPVKFSDFGNAKLTEPMKFLDVSDLGYLVLLETEKRKTAFEFKKEYVNGILYGTDSLNLPHMK